MAGTQRMSMQNEGRYQRVSLVEYDSDKAYYFVLIVRRTSAREGEGKGILSSGYECSILLKILYIDNGTDLTSRIGILI